MRGFGEQFTLLLIVGLLFGCKASPNNSEPVRGGQEGQQQAQAATSQLAQQYYREKMQEGAQKREVDIPVNTRNPKYRPYAYSLVKKIERKWKPASADLEGSSPDDRMLLMKVSIEKDGSVRRAEVLRKSPIESLNLSAIEAVHKAAPFRPLPKHWDMDLVHFYTNFEVIER